MADQRTREQVIEDALRLAGPADAAEAEEIVCTGWILVSEWMHADGSRGRWLDTLDPENQSPSVAVGLLRVAEHLRLSD